MQKAASSWKMSEQDCINHFKLILNERVLDIDGEGITFDIIGSGPVDSPTALSRFDHCL